MPVNDGVEYGETEKGFVAPRFPTWRPWVVRRAIERFGKNARTESTSRLGWVIDRIAWAMHVVFEGAAGAYNAAFYATAQGVDLDKQLAIVAFARLQKTKSKGELVLYGANLAVVPQGSRVATEDTGQAYETDGPATLGDKVMVLEIIALSSVGTVWKATVNGNDHTYTQLIDDTIELVAKGLAAAIGVQANYTGSYLGARPGGGHLIVVDSNAPALVIAVDDGSGSSAVFYGVRRSVTAADYGPVPGFAGTINDIRNPVFGWTGAINQLDVSIGRNDETDAAYRARWDAERFGPGKATEKAMRRAFRATEELREKVKAISVFEVPTQYFTVLLHAPELTNNEIAQIIEDCRPLGVATDGNASGTAINGGGKETTVKFSRAVVLYVWIKITITKGEAFPTLGDPADSIAKEVAPWGNGGPSPSHPLEAYAGLGLGKDLELFQLGLALNKAVVGIKNAVIEVGTTPLSTDPEPPYSAADIVVPEDTLLIFDSGKVTVII